MKKILVLLLLVLSTIPLFCDSILDGTDGTLIYIPTNVLNNKNVTIELSEAKSLSTDDISSNLASLPGNNLVLFRLIDMLKNSNQPSYAGKVTITSQNNWEFIKEDNPTIRKSFSLDAFCIEMTKDSLFSTNYTEHDPKKLGSTTTLINNVSATFAKGEDDAYVLNMPYTDFTSILNRAKTIRYFDICISIPETPSMTTLQPGYYYTKLTITYNQHREHPSGGSSSLYTPPPCEITIWAYVGDAPGQTGSVHSFSVLPGNDSYSMNLGSATASSTYHVAKISFLKSRIVTSTASSPNDKVKIYISPTANYRDAGTYKFILMQSESKERKDSNTVYYDLYIDTGNNNSGSYKRMSECGNMTTFPNGKLYSVKSGTTESLPSSTYILRSKYTDEDIGRIGGKTNYLETWELSQDIYIKLENRSIDSTTNFNGHDAGLYYSYIYFTLETNF